MDTLQAYDLHPLFEEAQLARVFEDGKTLVDCIPRRSLKEIDADYKRLHLNASFNLRSFIEENFDLPPAINNNYQPDISKGIVHHIEALWDVLTRNPAKAEGTLIALPYPYVVPGGRFGEIFYWDSYFTMLGLMASGKVALIRNMIDNFSYLINTYGFIPNGNRTYFLSRSQPPFFSMMVELLGKAEGKESMLHYLPELLSEYSFWMKGKAELTSFQIAHAHVVQMKDGELLNRYHDRLNTPRPESYRVDVKDAGDRPHASELFNHWRAACESGWDFSSRWYKTPSNFTSTHAADIIPVDLNCLLYKLEMVIAECYTMLQKNDDAERFNDLADRRSHSIHKYCWNAELEFYVDYDFRKQEQRTIITAAGLFPMFLNIATPAEARSVVKIMEQQLLKYGGIVTTVNETGQQWDAPNGWAPLQWVAIKGLRNYGYEELAANVARRWIKLNKEVFQRTGKLMEKYNVVNADIEAGGGEYAGQDGFGWTNGVLLALIRDYES